MSEKGGPFIFEKRKTPKQEKIDNPEKEAQEDLIKAEALKEKTESRVEILNRHKILFISCVEPGTYDEKINSSPDIPNVLKKRIMDEIGLDDADWFLDGLGFNNPDDKKRFQVVNATSGDEYPSTDDFSGVIIGGSPHMVGGDDFPWMRELEKYIRIASQKRVPILGVCFGHQMIAKAFGGGIDKTPAREFGTAQINLNEDGAQDDLFKTLPHEDLDVLMSHSEVISDIGSSGLIRSLGFNDHNLNQVIAVGDRIRGVQFHPEVPKEVLEAVAYLRRKGIEEEGLDFEKILRGLKDTPEAKRVLKNFDTYFVLKYALNKK